MSDSAPVVESPAPAPPAPTISAEQDASNRRDFAAFDEASEAARKGTPKARVTAPVEAPAAPAPTEPAPAETPAAPVEAKPATPPISKRQEDINNRIRDAVSRATAEKDAEIARLRGAQPPAEPAAREPEWKRIAAMPNAPKLADFESVEEHAAAMAVFVSDLREQSRRQSTLVQQRDTYETQRISAFDTRVSELEKTDPDIASVIIPIAQSLSQRGGPYAVMSDAILDSELGPQLLRHLGEHPELQQSIATLPPHLRGLPPAVAVREHAKLIVKALGKLEASLERPAEPEPAPASSPISKAPPPAPSLARSGASSDPQAAALARRDFKAWEKHETAKDLARRGAA